MTTERNIALAQRAGFVDHAKEAYSPQRHSDIDSYLENARRRAVARYPLPRVRRTRVLSARVPSGHVSYLNLRSYEGELQYAFSEGSPLGHEPTAWSGVQRELERGNTSIARHIQIVVQLGAGLLREPTEEVEE